MRKINLSDSAIDLWRFYTGNEPFCISMIGYSDCNNAKDIHYYVEREDSNILSVEYVRKGSGTLVINGKTYYPHEGSVIFLTRHSKHSYYPNPNDLWVKDWVILEGKLADTIVDLYRPDGEYSFDAPSFAYFFSELNNLYELYKDNYQTFTDNATILFIDTMQRLNRNNGNNPYDIAVKVKEMLDSHLEEFITMEDIATHYNYSVNYIIRSFKKKYNCTPHKYYLNKKIQLAKMYLINTADSISDIADKLHFTDQHYFSTVFKQYTSMSASEYRSKYSLFK